MVLRMADKNTDNKKSKIQLSDESIEALDELKNIKGLDNVIEFLSNLDTPELGLVTEKTSLLDVLASSPQDFSFFDSYYESSASIKNREFAQEQDNRFSTLKDQYKDPDSFLNKIMHKDMPELRKIIINSLRDED